MPNLYASRTDFRARAGYTASQTGDNAVLDAILEAASRAVEQITRRRFYVETRTRYYTAEFADLLFVDDLLSITTLKTDDDGDRVYETTWLTTDYDLEPYNAPFDSPPRPYTQLRTTPNGNQSFPTTRRGVEIVGSHGFYDARETSSTTVNEALDASETGVDVVDGTVLEVGQTILIDSEQMYISAIASNTLTVTRGVNGTTAATHASGAAIGVYTYPLVSEATLLLAGRLKSRKDSPAGLVGSADIGQIMTIGKHDPDVMTLLRPLTRLQALAV